MIERLLSYLFDFHGRFSRKQFWVLFLFCMLYFQADTMIFPSMFDSFSYPFLIVWLPAAIASMSGIVRRLHDLDKSARWLAPIFAIFAVLGLPMVTLNYLQKLEYVPEWTVDLAFSAWITIAGIPALFWYYQIAFVRGTIGENRFGPDPLAEKALAHSL